ncbi:MAG: Helicase associated domain protein [Planctomyces sp.]|nr:Helicase associated domain protein [Planctomyces sp.]
MTTWKLRDYQQPAYHTANGRSRVIVNMPTGWGKSFLLCALAASDLRDPSRRVVICVPQRIIAKGFGERKHILLPDGAEVDWSIPRNLCGTSTAKVDELTDFLLAGPAKSVARRVVLTTHMTLSCALTRLSDDELAEIADDTTAVIDESHHILASEQGRNVLGGQIARLLDLGSSGLKLWLATAYFFRGDHLPIISEAHLAEFIRVHVPFDEYWGILKHIKSYSYDFVTFKGTVFKELQQVLQSGPSAPTIIYCPPEGHNMLLGKPKAKFVARVQRIACECLNAAPWTSFDDALRQKSVVVDLVDTEQRAEKIRFVAEHGNRVSGILTVGMFREGADWVEAARIIDLVPTNSDQDRLQRFGRLVRDCPGKRHISYLNFFPLVVEQGEEERRRLLTKLYAHFHASLVLENAIEPIKVRLLPRPKHGPKDDAADPKTHFNLLGDFSEAKQEQIIRDTYEALLKLQAKKDDAGQSATPEEVKTAVVNALKENGVRKNLEPLAKQVLLLMRRKANVSVQTDDLVNAGFDKVWSTDIFDPIIAYSGGVGGPKTLAEIRDVVEGVFERQWQENYERIRNLPCPPDSQSSAYWWCTHNRTLHSQGKLPEAKVKLLEQIPWWTWTISVSDRWETNFEMIRAMAQCPKAGTPEYSWVRQQRRFYHQGKLEQRKIRLLESIPWWTWASLSSNWETNFAEVAALPERPARGTTLYEWVRTQRKEYKAGRLAPERAKRLESIPWWVWEERRSSKDDGLVELQICIREGVELGHTKTQVADKWAEIMGVGRDQVHKYLRKAEPAVRDQWKRLGDGRKRGDLSKEVAAP